MISKNIETYQTKHHPNDVFLVPANQLNKNNLEALYEKITLSNPGISKIVGLEFLSNYLNEQINKSLDENILNYKSIFDSSTPILVYVLLHLPSQKIEEIKDISLKFSSLEKENEILSFAKTYGLLGVSDWGWNNYSSNYTETLDTWYTYIEHIKRLIKLYKTLKEIKRGKETEIIGEFFNLEEESVRKIGVGLIKRTKISWTEKYRIREKESELLYGVNNIIFSAPNPPRELEESQGYDGLLGSYILARLIKEGLDGAIDISFSEVFLSDSSPIGFSFKETYSSQYLIGAIYLDLWRLVTTDTLIRYCNYCQRPFEGKGKKRHCNESCRQMAYKERKGRSN